MMSGYRPTNPADRKVVDLIVDAASGDVHLGILTGVGVNGRIVTELEALTAMGARLRSGYPVDAGHAHTLELIRRGPALPVIVDSTRRGYVLLPAEATR